jgi:peptidoglycan/LPS O-acetylase OafA/YrhL
MSPTSRRAIPTIGLAVVFGAVGGFAGAGWYQAFGPPWGQLGSEFEGWAEIFRGAATGALAGAFAGWYLVGRALGRRQALLAGVGSVAAGILVVVAVSQIGNFTNADGPPTSSVVITILSAAGAVMALALLARLSRPPRAALKQPPAL